jgi:hypothetical protein
MTRRRGPATHAAQPGLMDHRTLCGLDFNPSCGARYNRPEKSSSPTCRKCRRLQPVAPPPAPERRCGECGLAEGLHFFIDGHKFEAPKFEAPKEKA